MGGAEKTIRRKIPLPRTLREETRSDDHAGMGELASEVLIDRMLRESLHGGWVSHRLPTRIDHSTVEEGVITAMSSRQATAAVWACGVGAQWENRDRN